MSQNNITLQINISPGDVNYAQLTVPALVAQHQDISTRLLIVDCCRPQRTKLIDPDKKFPEKVFNEKVTKVVEISEQFLKEGLVTQVYYLRPKDPLINHLAKKYLRNLYSCTHAAGGTANMSYWAGIELSKTSYVLHYDGDMILYQEKTYSWVEEAIELIKRNKAVVIAVPRLCPPLIGFPSDPPSLQEGRDITSHADFWTNDWFSTRHFLLDKTRFESFLPLVQGKVMLELLVRKYGKRAFPIDPEILMFKSIGARGGKRLMLKSQKAWLTHPADKSNSYLEILPQLIESVHVGEFPNGQRGYENIKLAEWQKFFEINSD